jgi:FkbM family methyltransferase
MFVPILVTIAGVASTLLVLAYAYLRAARRRTFIEYSTRVRRFELAGEGTIEFAEWLHPKQQPQEFSQEQIDRLRAWVRPGDTVIDIGAHTGDTSVPLALAAGPTGCVFALEPNQHVFKVLAQNAQLNRERTNIVPLPFAATDRDGAFTFNYSDASFCNGGFLSQLKTRRFGHRYELEVQGKNLAAWLKREHPERLNRLSFIKIDAEGYDRQVIESLMPLLQAYRPVLQCEVYKRLDASERSALFDTLNRAGYDVHKLSQAADLRGEKLSSGDMQRWPHFDLLCTPRQARRAAA